MLVFLLICVGSSLTLFAYRADKIKNTNNNALAPIDPHHSQKTPAFFNS